MILTYKVRHNRNFLEEPRMAKQVADYALMHRTFTSKDVKHIGLKSMIANQILRKYGRNKTIKKAKNVNLIVPSQGIKADDDKRIIMAACLNLTLAYEFSEFERVSQIEVDKEYADVDTRPSPRYRFSLTLMSGQAHNIHGGQRLPYQPNRIVNSSNGRRQNERK